MNRFGRIFSVQIFGESHGFGVGILIDGCPPGLSLGEDDFIPDLIRRKSGSFGTTKRMESDHPIIKSGLYNGTTTGAPILIEFPNMDIKSEDYFKNRFSPRPGHSDFTAYTKFDGYNDFRGGGHFSGRLTAGIVAAGVIARKIISPAKIEARLIEAGGSKDIETAIQNAMDRGDSVGGLIECRATQMPDSLGEPYFDSVESVISHIIFSIPAIKGIEFGAGFKSAEMRGSENNDEIIDISGATKSNNSGGINGGITNGNDLIFRVAVKPTSSIAIKQKTVNLKTSEIQTIEVKGRHDACIALRAPVIIEAAAAIALADLKLINKMYKN
ncbi:MAG: chorismate synthase [Candidatus Kapabacteria bacterium]|nr:chorismate synthase [Ignavibacteriota bacterium]MCW5886150.1 chorismate synthase [Candidatus Kapabacteria bacterium]